MSGESKPKKHLGQHFLIDRRVLEGIVSAAGVSRGDVVFEIGAGTGALTSAILEKKPSVLFAVEVDPELAGYLRERFGKLRSVTVVNADIMKIDMCDYGNGFKVLGNLPYNIATAIIRRFVDFRHCMVSATVMVQKEVADRFLRSSGKEYGYLPAFIRQFFSAVRVMDVSPASFRPKPLVYSTVITFKPLGNPAVSGDEIARFESFLKRAFSSRRKKLRNVLGVKEYPQELEAYLGKRAEELSPEDLLKLFRMLTAL